MTLMTPLHFAAGLGRKDDVELLLTEGADVNATNEYNMTALHFAVGSRSKDIVNVLLTQGANVNITDKKGMTPLHYAGGSGSDNIVELLLVEGAEVDIIDKLYITPMYYNYTVTDELTRKDIVEMLLARGANVDITDQDDMVPLHYAAQWGHKDVVQLLLLNHSDPNIIQKGDTALSIAAQYEKTEVVKYLIENKDLYKILVNKGPIIEYYLDDNEMQTFLFRNGVIPESEEHNEAPEMQEVTSDQGRGVQTSCGNSKTIDESNVRNLVKSIARNILEAVDNMSEVMQNMLRDHIMHTTPITSVLSNPSLMTFEQQQLFVVINENILEKLFEVVPNYEHVIPTICELKLIIDNLHKDQLFVKWANAPLECMENKQRQKETK